MSASAQQRIEELERQVLGLTVALHSFANTGARRKTYELNIKVQNTMITFLSDSSDSLGEPLIYDLIQFGTPYQPVSFREMQRYLVSDQFITAWNKVTDVFDDNTVDSIGLGYLGKWEGEPITTTLKQNGYKLRMTMCMEEQELRTETRWFPVPKISKIP